MQMRTLNMQARTLADDLFLTTKIDNATQHSLHIFARAFNMTMQHLQDLGGRIAPHKSKIIATTTAHREWLKRFRWAPINTTIA
eukprot:9650728-Karenia_brevis.AAC.1